MLRTASTKSAHSTTLDFASHELQNTLPAKNSNPKKSSPLIESWRTAALLQTTLDLKSILFMFSNEVKNTIAHSGLSFQHQSSLSYLTIGRSTKQTCSFHLSIEKENLGTITFMSGKPFTHNQISQLEFLLSGLVYPLRNALQHLSTHHYADIDPLTGNYNRLILKSNFEHEIGLYRRYKTPLTILAIDIDNFHYINQRFGRQVGDKVIQATANSLSEQLRQTDTFVRYAGDEFIVLLSHTQLSDAEIIAEHLRDYIEHMQVIHEELTLNFTISIGAAPIVPNDDAYELFLRAHESLIEAKKKGRNYLYLFNKKI